MRDIRVIHVSGEFNVVGYRIEEQNPAFIAGAGGLVQAVIDNLITRPGSDALNPDRGGALIDILRRYRTNDSQLRDAIQEAIETVEDYMKQEQSLRSLEPEERLRHLRLIDIKPGSRPDEILIELTLATESGDSINLTI